ncbi:MAG: anaerobic ribonucleoside-triphosphate reductase activating protein [Treponema sp.]|jgi:anaerobic ribonucleoside-triphosphate reductase activating protein|nr:anaerobic ribonucleoside-triphosphate reductase activating protein [Treponema sp.]
MRLSGIIPESVVDGPGLRIVIFTQGCPHQCPHCQNPETWDRDAGKEFSVRQVIRSLKQHKKNKRGITFSGGEPFLQPAELVQAANAARQMGLDIVTYTGFTYEELIADTNDDIKSLLSATDILIDGKYIHALRNIGLQFRGSSNQRLIDIAITKKTGQLTLWEQF